MITRARTVMVVATLALTAATTAGCGSDSESGTAASSPSTDASASSAIASKQAERSAAAVAASPDVAETASLVAALRKISGVPGQADTEDLVKWSTRVCLRINDGESATTIERYAAGEFTFGNEALPAAQAPAVVEAIKGYC